MAKVHVWHSLSGEIVAIGRTVGKAGCLPVAGENQSVLELEVADEHIESLHQTHFVDPVKKSLVALKPDYTRPQKA